MTSAMVSQVLLWIVVILQGVTILALARQIGVLHDRVAPAGALTTKAVIAQFELDEHCFVNGPEVVSSPSSAWLWSQRR